ncbi:MAG: glycosyltransferase family 39 protein [Halobacteria archaeon]|nr:glycosyltransferase family 39 protein [Candidatus Bathyarchaeota archaeon]
MLLGILFVATLIRIYGYALQYVNPDDSVYLASCGLILHGYRPYVDFFLAHPPLYFWIVVGLWRILNVNDTFIMWAIGKSVSIISFLGTTILIYLIGRKFHRYSGLIAAALYQFESFTYHNSIICSPSILATALLVTAMFLIVYRAPLPLVGLTLGLATNTRLSALYTIPAFGFYILWMFQKKQITLRTIATSVILYSIPLLPLLSFPFDKLFFNLGTFHFIKGGMTPTYRLQKLVFSIVPMRIPLLCLGFGSLVYLKINRSPNFVLLAALSLSLLGPYLQSPIGSPHLLLEAIPFFVLLSSITLSEVIHFPIHSKNKAPITLLVVLLLYSFSNSIPLTSDAINLAVYTQNTDLPKLVEIAQQHSNINEMVFSQLSLIPFLANRPYPPLVDTSPASSHAGVYTQTAVKELIIKYKVKVLILAGSFVNNKLATFLRAYGYRLTSIVEKRWMVYVLS